MLSLLLLLVASFSFAQKTNGIAFEKTTQKFNKVNEGESVTLVYKFSNYSKFIMNISPPEVDCSCTEVILPVNTISSGTQDSIIIKFNTKDKIGWQERNVTIQFISDLMDSKNIDKTLTFKGMVKASKATKKAYKLNKKQ